MKSFKRILLAGLFGVLACLAAGCSSSAPGCADARTKELVIKIVNEEAAKRVGSVKANQASYKLEAIRTQSLDKATGACSCAADLVVTFEGRKEVVSISYASELTSQKGEFYVTVYEID